MPADAAAVGTEISDLKSAMSSKADLDGYYEDMSVGSAEQLISSVLTEDEAPYKFRTSGGSADIGNRAYMDKIVGGTVAWNQLWDASSRTATETAGNISQLFAVFHKTFVSGHKYLALCKQNGAVGSITKNTISYNDGSSTYYNTSSQNNHLAAGMHYWIFSAASSTTSGSIWLWSHTPDVDVTYSDPQLFDLTQMLGSTVADYIYSLEQSTAGAGVAFFRSLFPKPYYEYNTGELISVSGLQSHDTVGFNAWDEEWELGGIDTSTGQNITGTDRIRSKNYIPVVPNTSYYFFNGSTKTYSLRWYDADKNFIGVTAGVTASSLYNTPSNCAYMRFIVVETTYGNDICINLSWSGARNGEYESYKKHSYPLDYSLTLRGVPKLDSSNKLYWDGDEYAPDGTVTRRYGIVDLGTLNWTYELGVPRFYTQDLASVIFKPDGNTVSNVVCPKYVARPVNNIYASETDKIIGVSNLGAVNIKDTSYTTVESFKASLSGVYLIYELATPTTETADAYQQVQNVDDYGTEEFVSTSIVPVGHVTRYPANLRDKLQHLPDLAASNGTYVILQSGSQMSLAPLTTPTELPAAPSADGTYTLKATVSNGAVTYSWGA